MCLFVLLYCVIGISGRPVGLVVLYEQDVQDGAVELGLIRVGNDGGSNDED